MAIYKDTEGREFVVTYTIKDAIKIRRTLGKDADIPANGAWHYLYWQLGLAELSGIMAVLLTEQMEAADISEVEFADKFDLDSAYVALWDAVQVFFLSSRPSVGRAMERIQQVAAGILTPEDAAEVCIHSMMMDSGLTSGEKPELAESIQAPPI